MDWPDSIVRFVGGARDGTVLGGEEAAMQLALHYDEPKVGQKTKYATPHAIDTFTRTPHAELRGRSDLRSEIYEVVSVVQLPDGSREVTYRFVEVAGQPKS